MATTLKWAPGEPIPEVLLTSQANRVIIDGVSGSGKTTFASAWAAQQNYLLLHLEDWYPGWCGLAEGTRITEDLLSGRIDHYPQWDWEHDRVAQMVEVPVGRRWMIEGCGALTPATKAAADLTVWVEVPLDVAKQRGLDRDGDYYARWWDQWHQQELRHWQLHQPRTLADFIVDAS